MISDLQTFCWLLMMGEIGLVLVFPFTSQLSFCMIMTCFLTQLYPLCDATHVPFYVYVPQKDLGQSHMLITQQTS